MMRRSTSSFLLVLVVCLVQSLAFSEAIVDVLLETAKNKQEKSSVRQSAILKLGQTPGEEAYKALTSLLDDKGIRTEERIFSYIIIAFSHRMTILGDKRAIGHMKNLFEEGVHRGGVLKFLAAHGDRTLDKKVLTMLKSGEIELSTVVGSNYLQITDPTVRNTFRSLLVKQLSSKSYSQRSAGLRIIRSLSAICDAQIVELLIQLFDDQEMINRGLEPSISMALFRICQNNLGSSSHENFEAVKPVVMGSMVIEASPDVWREWWKENKATFDLTKQTIAALKHPDPLIRRLVLEKTVWIESLEGDALLRTIVKDELENRSLRIYAAKALAARGDRRSIQTLVQVIEDSTDSRLFIGILTAIARINNDSPGIIRELGIEIVSQNLSPEQRGKIISTLNEWAKGL
jgi:HEAT repeat protein